MNPARLLNRMFAPMDRLAAALADPTRRERTVVAMLVVYAVLWTLFGTLAKESQDIHNDMSEMVAWSRELAFGYWKHPPLGAWITAAWFAIFPTADWAFYLLAMTMATFALWFAWRLAGDYLDGEKRALALPLLMLVPFFNFHALKFNANTVLLAMWGATAWCFLRSFERRSAGWAVLAGLCAAGSMLGKYWSIFLLAGLGLAALLDARRAAYFRSPAPWITIAVGALAFAPHVVWLVANDFVPFTYAAAIHTGTHAAAATSIVGYLAGSVGYVTLPVLLALAAMRPSRAALADMLWPAGPERRLAAAAFWWPLLLPALIAPLVGAEINSLWSMSAWALLPVVLLSAPRSLILPGAARAIFGVSAAISLAALAAAPVVAILVLWASPPTPSTHLLAERVMTEWRKLSNVPIRLVGGEAGLAFGTAFYLPDRPSAFPNLDPRAAPWVDDARIARDGIVLVCRAAANGCIGASAALARGQPSSRQVVVEITRRYLGIAGQPERYTVIVVPPR